ncbi:MAG: type II toxin-antitoxin system VapC family toxin [Planctomycetes bacterium]|nr:type II toxin-antitoxin system VapC family toxin [Planctomycetota bacterium]
MRILLDTDILTRSAQPSHPQHDAAVNAVFSLRTRGDALFLVPQNVYEFWVVATRPVGENGLGMEAASTAARLSELKRAFTLLEESPALYLEWERLVTEHGVLGKSAHDARLVAAMRHANVDGILTFNKAHFSRYTGLTVLTPGDLAG